MWVITCFWCHKWSSPVQFVVTIVLHTRWKECVCQQLPTTCLDSCTPLVEAPNNLQPGPLPSSVLDGGGCGRPLSADSYNLSRGCSGNAAAWPQDRTASSSPLLPPRTESDLSGQSERESGATTRTGEAAQSLSAKCCLKPELKRSDLLARSAASPWWPAGTDLPHKREHDKPLGGCSASASPGFLQKRVMLLSPWSTAEYLKPKGRSNARNSLFP